MTSLEFVAELQMQLAEAREVVVNQTAFIRAQFEGTIALRTAAERVVDKAKQPNALQYYSIPIDVVDALAADLQPEPEADEPCPHCDGRNGQHRNECVNAAEQERDEDIKMAEGLNTSLSIALDAAEAKVRHLEARLEAALHALHNIAEDEWQGSIWHREGITADTYAVWRARVELESQDASDEGE